MSYFNVSEHPRLDGIKAACRYLESKGKGCCYVYDNVTHFFTGGLNSIKLYWTHK